MGVALYLIGHCRGAEPLHAWLGRARRWFEDSCADMLEHARLGESGDGEPLLSVKLHPAAEDIEISAAGERRIVVSARTTGVGPGYHTYLCERLVKLGHTLAVEWEGRDANAATGDPTGFFHGGRRADVEREMLAWIHDTCTRVLYLPAGTTRVALSLPADTSFDADGHVLTPLGPRDSEWLARVAAGDPRAGAEFFPWWEDGVGPSTMLGRALCLMWTDVRWRPPLDDEERKRLELIARLLEDAHRLDASLEYPWREWGEILGYLGGKPPPHADVVTRRAARIPPRTPLVGYRRRPVTLHLPGGWRVRVPGEFAESWDAEGTLAAGQPPRTLWVTTFVFNDATGAPLPSEQLFSAVDDEGGGERVEHQDGALRGRAFLRRVEAGAESHWELAGESAVPGAMASCTIAFDSEADKAWAVDTWKSVGKVDG